MEFVSPPMPITEMFNDLEKVIAWAKRTGCYTNKSTGLHMNVSIPGFDLSNLDYVKLILLTGDNYILHSFDRRFNSWCKSTFDILESNIVNMSESDILDFFTKLKSELKFGSREIFDGYYTKYISINAKDNRIEFRGPGGDWLNSNINWLKIVLSRFVVVLNATMHGKEGEENYKKKLYKLMSQYVSNNDILKAFVNFSVDRDTSSLKTNIKNKPKIVKHPLVQISTTADKIKQQKLSPQNITQQPSVDQPEINDEISKKSID